MFPSPAVGVDRKPEYVTIDVTKLSPGIAKKLRALDVGLPPGLAKKPPDHPGRTAWLRKHAK
jgi:hypothetical protein